MSFIGVAGGNIGGDSNIVVNVMANIQNFTAGMKNAQNQLKGVVSESKGFANSLLSLKNLWLGWLTFQTGKSILEQTVGDLANFERYEISFKVLFQSADAAKIKMQELWDFAAKTPFQMDEVVRASMVMESFGLNSRKYLKDVADLASAFPHGKIEVIARAIGRIKSGDFGEALERMRDFGISSQMLREKGISFSGTGQVQNSANELLDAVIKIIRERFGGMTDEISKTMYGRWTTMIDLLKQSGRQLAGGIFDPLKGELEVFIQWLDRIQKNGSLDLWAARAKFWLGEVKKGLVAVGGFAMWVASAFMTYWPSIEPILKGVAIALILNKIITSDLFNVMKLGVTAVIAFARALWTLLIAKDAANAITLLKLAVEALEAATGVGIILVIVGALTMLILQSNKARKALTDFFLWAESKLNSFALYWSQKWGFMGQIIAGLLKMLGLASGGLASVFEPIEDMAARQAKDMDAYMAEVAARNKDLMDLQNNPDILKLLDRADTLPDVPARDTHNTDPVNDLTKDFDFRRKAAEFQMENQQILNKLANQGEGTFRYWEDTKASLLRIRDIMLEEVQALNGLIPGLTGELKEKALDKLWEATKRSNEILLQIKENTDPRGDFNMPSGIRPVSLFDVKQSENGARTFSFANAQFVFQFKDAPKSVEEFFEMMKIVQAGTYQQLMDRVVRG